MKNPLGSITNAETFHEIVNVNSRGRIKEVWIPSPRQMLLFQIEEYNKYKHFTLNFINFINPQTGKGKGVQFFI